MSKKKKPAAVADANKGAGAELSDEQLERIAGGTDAAGGKTVEQALNIGSQSSGAGAGKITFNPF